MQFNSPILSFEMKLNKDDLWVLLKNKFYIENVSNTRCQWPATLVKPYRF